MITPCLSQSGKSPGDHRSEGTSFPVARAADPDLRADSHQYRPPLRGPLTRSSLALGPRSRAPLA